MLRRSKRSHRAVEPYAPTGLLEALKTGSYAQIAHAFNVQTPPIDVTVLADAIWSCRRIRPDCWSLLSTYARDHPEQCVSLWKDMARNTWSRKYDYLDDEFLAEGLCYGVDHKDLDIVLHFLPYSRCKVTLTIALQLGLDKRNTRIIRWFAQASSLLIELIKEAFVENLLKTVTLGRPPYEQLKFLVDNHIRVNSNAVYIALEFDTPQIARLLFRHSGCSVVSFFWTACQKRNWKRAARILDYMDPIERQMFLAERQCVYCVTSDFDIELFHYMIDLGLRTDLFRITPYTTGRSKIIALMTKAIDTSNVSVFRFFLKAGFLKEWIDYNSLPEKLRAVWDEKPVTVARALPADTWCPLTLCPIEPNETYRLCTSNCPHAISMLDNGTLDICPVDKTYPFESCLYINSQ